MFNPPRFQFSVGSLLLVTTVVAVVMGVLTWLRIPIWDPVFQGLLYGYLVFLGVWVIIRGPRVLRGLREVRQRRDLLKMKRVALAEEVRVAKEAAAARKKQAQNEGPSAGGG